MSHDPSRIKRILRDAEFDLDQVESSYAMDVYEIGKRMGKATTEEEARQILHSNRNRLWDIEKALEQNELDSTDVYHLRRSIQ